MAEAMPKTNRIPIMMSDAEVKAIDDWRFANRVPTRSEAVRQLTELGLAFKEQEDAAAMGVIVVLGFLNGQGASIKLLEHYVHFLRKMDLSSKNFPFPELLRPLSKDIDPSEIISAIERLIEDLKKTGAKEVVATLKPSSEGQE